MKETSWLYAINGEALIAPDAGVEMIFTDIDSGASGRDEAGIMHRIVARSKVPSWHFCYSTLCQQEFSHMLRLISGLGSFDFAYPDPMNPSQSKTARAYVEKYSITWQSAPQGQYRNLKFVICAC